MRKCQWGECGGGRSVDSLVGNQRSVLRRWPGNNVSQESSCIWRDNRVLEHESNRDVSEEERSNREESSRCVVQPSQERQWRSVAWRSRHKPRSQEQPTDVARRQWYSSSPCQCWSEGRSRIIGSRRFESLEWSADLLRYSDHPCRENEIHRYLGRSCVSNASLLHRSQHSIRCFQPSKEGTDNRQKIMADRRRTKGVFRWFLLRLWKSILTKESKDDRRQLFGDGRVRW